MAAVNRTAIYFSQQERRTWMNRLQFCYCQGVYNALFILTLLCNGRVSDSCKYGLGLVRGLWILGVKQNSTPPAPGNSGT